MEFKIDSLNLKDVEKIRLWRNENLQALRTPYLLTSEMQEDFYNNVISNRQSNNRFWGLKKQSSVWCFVGMIGLVNIEWENSIGEISIIIDPSIRHCGVGEKAIDILLDYGFNHLNLSNIYGECYKCNEAHIFWEKICNKYNAYVTMLPARKYYNGEYHDSMYFNINTLDYLNNRKNKIVGD